MQGAVLCYNLVYHGKKYCVYQNTSREACHIIYFIYFSQYIYIYVKPLLRIQIKIAQSLYRNNAIKR